jgi:hypothetical protein
MCGLLFCICNLYHTYTIIQAVRFVNRYLEKRIYRKYIDCRSLVMAEGD